MSRSKSRRARSSPGTQSRRRPSGVKPLATVPAKAAPTPGEGQATCHVCRNAVRVTPRGNLRGHRDLFGNPCPNKALPKAERILDELPPVALPPQRPTRPAAERPAREPKPKVTASDDEIAANASLAPVTGHCHDCGKWVPGERKLCGYCAAVRDSRPR